MQKVNSNSTPSEPDLITGLASYKQTASSKASSSIKSNDDTIICRCCRINQGRIRSIVLEDRGNLETVIQQTNASQHCGGCYDELESFYNILKATHRNLQLGQPELPFE